MNPLEMFTAMKNDISGFRTCSYLFAIYTPWLLDDIAYLFLAPIHLVI